MMMETVSVFIAPAEEYFCISTTGEVFRFALSIGGYHGSSNVLEPLSIPVEEVGLLFQLDGDIAQYLDGLREIKIESALRRSTNKQDP
jgi:hypothetical protein